MLFAAISINWGVAALVVLLLGGLGLFLFNMRMAVSGYRQMRNHERDVASHKTAMVRLEVLQLDLHSLKVDFDSATASMIEPERKELWKPVSDKQIAAINCLLTNDGEAARTCLEEAVELARQIVEDLA